MSFGLNSQASWSSSSDSELSGSGFSSRRLGNENDNDNDEDDELLNAVQELQSPPPRPSRIDYESYTALVRNIDKGDNLISKKILAIRASEPDPPRNNLGQDDPTENLSSEGSTTRWPLQPGQLGQLNEVVALEDSILAYASCYVRQHNLILPRQEGLARRPDLDLELDVNLDLETAELDDLDERIPAFLPNMMDLVDSLLDSLATMRPEGTRRKRQMMRPMGWESVVHAGVLSGFDPE